MKDIFINFGRSYEAVGAKIVPELSWRKKAPQDAVIIGLKELPEDGEPITHKHVHLHFIIFHFYDLNVFQVFFAHSFKGQKQAPSVLSRFRAGKGATPRKTIPEKESVNVFRAAVGLGVPS